MDINALSNSRNKRLREEGQANKASKQCKDNQGDKMEAQVHQEVHTRSQDPPENSSRADGLTKYKAEAKSASAEVTAGSSSQVPLVSIDQILRGNLPAIPPFVPNVVARRARQLDNTQPWEPLLETASNRLILKSDSVQDYDVARGLVKACLLPHDVQDVKGMSGPSLAPAIFKDLLSSLQKVHELDFQVLGLKIELQAKKTAMDHQSELVTCMDKTIRDLQNQIEKIQEEAEKVEISLKAAQISEGRAKALAEQLEKDLSQSEVKRAVLDSKLITAQDVTQQLLTELDRVKREEEAIRKKEVEESV